MYKQKVARRSDCKRCTLTEICQDTTRGSNVRALPAYLIIEHESNHSVKAIALNTIHCMSTQFPVPVPRWFAELTSSTELMAEAIAWVSAPALTTTEIEYARTLGDVPPISPAQTSANIPLGFVGVEGGRVGGGAICRYSSTCNDKKGRPSPSAAVIYVTDE